MMDTTSASSATAAACSNVRPLPDPLSILLVGEGNLSFTYALVRRLSRSSAFRRATQSASPGPHGSVAEVMTTTFDDADGLGAKYPESATFRAYFAAKQRVPVRYLGSVNATAMSSSLRAQAASVAAGFHLVIFNNPHIGFEDLYRQRSLLSHFFASAAELNQRGAALAHPQELVVAVCDDQAMRWDLLGCAARNGYLCVAAQPLLPSDYPEYTNRRHQSDAAFPFQRMVQYWFVQPSNELQPALADLRDEMALWERRRDAHTKEGHPCGFSCSAWLDVAGALLAAPAVDSGAENAARPASDTSSVSGKGCHDGPSLNYAACDSVVPLPLLHPTVVDDVLQRLLDTPPQPSHDSFTPYLPSAAWAPLYRAQRLAEEHWCSIAAPPARAGEVLAAPAVAVAVPPHLDPSALGRPLTTREATKLERYLAGYGAAMKAKALQQKQEKSVPHDIWSCTACSPPRAFDTEQDLHQHRASKHSGAVQLPPTLYARVHAQIDLPATEATGGALEADFAAMSFQSGAEACYCGVCGLQFKTQDAFEEHLRYLSPLPGDEEDALTCELCQPPRHFTDRRGLEQHRSSKHMPVCEESEAVRVASSSS